MEFEIQPEYTVEDFAAFWRGFLEKRPGKAGVKRISERGMRLGGWLFLLAGASLLAVCWLNPLELSAIPAAMVLWGLAFLVLGAVTLFQRRPGQPVQPRWARRAWRRWSEQGAERHWRYRFTPEGMELHNGGSDHRYDYDMLQQLWEDEEHFYLALLDQRGWHILNKPQFTRGDPARFAAFLAERTGKPVRWVNGERERACGGMEP